MKDWKPYKYPKIMDIAEALPDMHHTHATGRGLYSVSEGKVHWSPFQKAVCHKHEAMNCVSEDGHIWRCLNCGEGLYKE